MKLICRIVFLIDFGHIPKRNNVAPCASMHSNRIISVEQSPLLVHSLFVEHLRCSISKFGGSITFIRYTTSQVSWPSSDDFLRQKYLQLKQEKKKTMPFPYHTKFCCFSNIQRFISFPIFPSCHAKIYFVDVCVCVYFVWRTALSHSMMLRWYCDNDGGGGGASCFKFLIQSGFLISMVSY